MSSHRTTITAVWPHVPLGCKVEMEMPESYDAEGLAYQVNEVAAELRKGTLAGRFILTFILPLLQKIGLVRG